MVAKQQFVITRRLKAVVGSQEDQERLKAKAPYVRPKVSPYSERPRKIVRVERPVTWSYTKWAVKLLEYKAPQDLINAAFGLRPSHNVKPFIPTPLALNNYGKRWQALIWIEEKMRYDTHKSSPAADENRVVGVTWTRIPKKGSNWSQSVKDIGTPVLRTHVYSGH